jgi:hypothetical protein
MADVLPSPGVTLAVIAILLCVRKCAGIIALVLVLFREYFGEEDSCGKGCRRTGMLDNLGGKRDGTQA